MKKILLATILSVLPFVANAKDIDVKPVIGGDFSYIKADLQSELDRIVENHYSSFSGIIGIKINDEFGLEAFYQQSLDEKSLGIITTNFNAFGFDALAYIPLEENLYLIPSFGMARYKIVADINGYGSNNEDGLGIRTGIGFQININENVGLRISGRYVHLDIESVDDIMELSTGLRFSF